ncbi:MAG: serine/threonine-protein kinase [Polyangiales bacterium]
MAPTVDDRYLLAGATLDGRVAVEAPVARGGFGVVYRGLHLGLNVPVAVKVLRVPEQYAEAVRQEFYARFVQEARLVYQLAHPAIVRLLDHGVSAMPSGEVAPWMVLEWLDGLTLSRWRRTPQGAAPLTRRAALALLRPCLEALAAAHAQGVSHRDVTPANVFVVDGPRGPTTRLIDFGVARVAESPELPGSGHTATESTITAFSRAYAAPEQLGHTRTGPWTDVHAVGLVLTEVLTGRVPYEGRDDAELLTAAMSPARPTPASKGVDVGAWEPVLARALALRPADRYPDVGSLLAALDATVDAGAVAPPSRHRVPAWLSIALAVGASAGLVVGAVRIARRPAPVALMPAPRVEPPATPPPVPSPPVAAPTPAAPAPILAPPPAPRAAQPRLRATPSRTRTPSRRGDDMLAPPVP